MTPAAFIDLLRRIVLGPATEGTISQIENPAGRNHSEAVKRRAAWFRALSDEDRAYFEYAVSKAAESAIFGIFCVLDGARAIESGEARGHLELTYVKAGSVTLLASSATEAPAPFLHEIL